MGKKQLRIFMIGLIFIIGFLFIWMNQWKYLGEAENFLRINRITGKADVLTLNGWITVEKKPEEQGTKKTEPDFEEFDKFLQGQGFISLDKLPNDKEIREAAKEYNQKVSEIYMRKEKRFP